MKSNDSNEGEKNSKRRNNPSQPTLGSVGFVTKRLVANSSTTGPYLPRTTATTSSRPRFLLENIVHPGIRLSPIVMISSSKLLSLKAEVTLHILVGTV